MLMMVIVLLMFIPSNLNDLRDRIENAVEAHQGLVKQFNLSDMGDFDILVLDECEEDDPDCFYICNRDVSKIFYCSPGNYGDGYCMEDVTEEFIFPSKHDLLPDSCSNFEEAVDSFMLAK